MDKLKEIIIKYIDIAPDKLSDDMNITSDLGIDSFSLISMIVEIEETFNVEIPDFELGEFQTLKELYSYIQTHKKG